MAIIRETQYPGLWNVPSVNNPQGNFKNETVDGAEDGSYLESVWKNDEDALRQSLLIAAGITPNGNPDEGGNSQVFQALVEMASGRAVVLIESPTSAVNAYVVEEKPNGQAPAALFDGLTIKFPITAANTTSTPTINAFGLGAKQVTNINGTTLSAGQVRTSRSNEFFYFATGDIWVLIDRDEFDSKLRGLGYNGHTVTLGANVDAIYQNSKSYYGQAIPGVTASPTDGVLTVEMASTLPGGGQQTFLVTDPLSSQLGQKWVRFLSGAGVWDASWRGPFETPAIVAGYDTGLSTSYVSDFNGVYRLEMDQVMPETTWTSVGKVGSGADYEWADLNLVPDGAKKIIFEPSVTGTETLVGSDSTRLIRISARTNIGASLEKNIFIDQRTARIGSNSIALGGGESIVPIINGLIFLRWTNQYSSQSCDLFLRGWLE